MQPQIKAPRTIQNAETVTTTSRLEAVIASALRHPAVALDLESNGFHRYPERVCLVQLAVGEEIYLLDPLGIEDISPLGELLATPSVLKVFHAADYDIRSLDRDWSFHVSPLFDTSIAAAFVGHGSLGLATLLKECLNVEIPKSKRLQRADWTVRPVTSELLEYAAEDVRHLIRLAESLRQGLEGLGRTDWVDEECERLASVRYAAPDTKNAYLSIKGVKNLDGRGLAILRSLHGFREEEAIRRDRPPFKIFSNAVMLALAENPLADLASVKGVGRYAYGRNASGMRKALKRGVNARPIERPRSPASASRRISSGERSAARKRLRLLKQWRMEQARSLGIEAGLVWPAASLDRLSLDPRNLEDEILQGDVRRWQFQRFGESLSTFLRN